MCDRVWAKGGVSGNWFGLGVVGFLGPSLDGSVEGV